MPEPEYAERSMVVYVNKLNKRGKPSERLDPADVNGENVRDVFLKHCAGEIGKVRRLGGTDRYINFLDCVSRDYGMLITLESGFAGEKGRIVDGESARTVAEYEEDDINFVKSRVLFDVVPGYDYGIMYVEYTNGSAGNITIPHILKSYLRERMPDVTVNNEAFMLGRDLEAIASVEMVEVKHYVKSEDVADYPTIEGSSLVQRLTHKRGKPFGKLLYSDIMKGKDNLAGLFGLSGTLVDPNEEDVVVSIEVKTVDGRTRKMTVGSSLEMPMREVLNESGHAPLDDDEFVNRCREREREITDKLGRKGS